MELLLAFLIAFGFFKAEDVKKLNQSDAKDFIQKNNLEKDYLIWEAEGDDF